MKKFLTVAICALMFLTAGCDDNNPPPDKPEVKKEVQNKNDKDKQTEQKKVVTPEKKTQSENPLKTLDVKVYYPDEDGMNLVAVKRQIKIHNDSEKYFETVKLLLEQPKEKNLTKIFAKNAKIDSVTFKDGTATVDFNKNITKGFAGGSTGEETLINSVVQTLTEFDEVKQVRFLVDGKEVETLSGHMDLSEPIKRTT